MTEKSFALEIKKQFFLHYLQYEDFSSLYYPEESIQIENFNFDLLKEELNKFNIKVARGCDLKHINKIYNNEWDKFKTIFVYADECDL